MACSRGIAYLLLKAYRSPVHVGHSDDVAEIHQASATVYSIHDCAQREADLPADWQPVQHHQAGCDVTVNVQLVVRCASAFWMHCRG